MSPRRDPVLAVRRSFHLVQAVMAGCATRSEIEAYIRAAIPQDDPYAGADAEAQWQRDRDRVLTDFGVFLAYDPITRTNRITDLEPHGWLALPHSALQTLVLLRETFRDDAPFHQEVTALLNLLGGWLPAHQRDMVHRRRNIIALNLHSLDSQDISPMLFEQVQMAVNHHRRVTFDYYSPRQSDGIPRRHTVDPQGLNFDDGHWYLYGYWRQSDGPSGVPYYPERHRHFRLTAIDATTFTILSDKVTPRPEPHRKLCYLLHPDLTRGTISRRFPATQATGTYIIDGIEWTELTSTITPSQEFRAAQMFLRYGSKCRVLEPESLRQKIVELVRGLAELYLGE